MSQAAPRTGPAWGFLAGGLVAILAMIAIFGRGLGLDPHSIDSPLIGQPAPNFALPLLGGEDLVNSHSLRGQPVVLNFWATWCESCPLEHPLLVDAARRHAGRVRFVGIAYNDTNERILSWLQRHGGASYDTLVDINGKAAIAFGVYGVPETYVIDAEGTIRFKHTGMIRPELLDEQIRELM